MTPSSVSMGIMKTSSSLLSLVSTVALCLLAGVAASTAQTDEPVTFTQGSIIKYSTITLPPYGGLAVTNDATDVATVLPSNTLGQGSLTWYLCIRGVTNIAGGLPYPTSFPPSIAGLATIAITNTSAFPVFFTVKIETPNTNTVQTALGTVVIPADAGGPVTVILESSTDMITWTAATPGSYGTSTTKRFFRLRATR